MRTLRAQVTALLVVAMLVVLAFANAASFFLAGPPDPRNDAVITATVRQFALAAELAGPDAPVQGTDEAGIRDRPPEGTPDPMGARFFSDALARIGKPFPVEVVLPDGGGAPIVALKLANGRWLTTQLALRGPMFGPGPPPPHPNRTWGFATWLILLTAGTTLVVVFAVRRLMRPLALIEDAAARIGPGGDPPVLPEEGPTELRAAARAINRLSARLKSSMESRMRIVAAAAHDLRTPLTRMRLRAEFIADDEERGQWLNDLAELDRIADSAIRLVREEVEGGEGEPVPLDELARVVAEEVREAGLRADLASATPVTVTGRALALKRSVRNLVVNAATHGGGARIAVAREGGNAVLTIEDDGPGIPEALMGQVFEPFFRVDPARQAKIAGAGLGLAIANEIVIRHGGRLTLTNRPGGGLLQRLELPALAEG